MTTEQKDRIAEMRRQGCTYAKIAETLSISENTIKTYCRRTRLNEDNLKAALVCKLCGNPIEVKDKHRARQFCSDKCRAAWWYANRGKARLCVRTFKEGKEWYWDIPEAAKEIVKEDNIP